MSDTILERAQQFLANRVTIGEACYGRTLDDNPASVLERLQHLKEELADGLQYVIWAEDEIASLQRDSEALAEERSKNETLTVRLAYINVWWQALDAYGVRASTEHPEDGEYLDKALADLASVLDDKGSDRAWLNKANATTEALAVAKGFLQSFVAYHDAPCRLDHHGYCQEHFLEMGNCTVAEVRAWLEIQGASLQEKEG